MRKAGDENARISSAHFRIEIDEDEEEEEDDEGPSMSPSETKNDVKCIPASVDSPRREGEFSRIDKNPLLPTDGNGSRIAGNDGSSSREARRVAEEVSALSPERRANFSLGKDNRIDGFPKIDDLELSRRTIEELPESIDGDPVVIKLSPLDMSAAASLAPHTDKPIDELSIAKFIFTPADRAGATSVGRAAKNFLEVPQRYDDRRRVYDVSSSYDKCSVVRSTRMNDPAAKGSVSSPDFLTDPRCTTRVNGNVEDPQRYDESGRAAIFNSPEKNATCARRPSITNAAIGSSIATSLVGASGGVPRSLLGADVVVNELLGRSATPSSISISSTIPSDDAAQEDGPLRLQGRRKSKLPFLRLHMPQPHSWSNVTAASELDDQHQAHQHHHNHNNRQHHHSLGTHFPHIHVPSFTFAGDGTARKFNFGIRRHSQMVSPL